MTIACIECHGVGKHEHPVDKGRTNRHGDPIPDYNSVDCERCEGEGIEFCDYHEDRPADCKVPGESIYVCAECMAEIEKESNA